MILPFAPGRKGRALLATCMPWKDKTRQVWSGHYVCLAQIPQKLNSKSLLYLRVNAAAT